MTALVDEAYKAGGYPFVLLKDHSVDRALLNGAQEEQYNMMADFEANVMKEMDAYIGLRSGSNIFEQSDVPADKMKIQGNTIGKKYIEKFAFQKQNGSFFATQTIQWRSLLK